MAGFEYGNRNFEMQQAETLIRENLKDEIAAKEAIVKRVDDLTDIVDIAIAALQDHQPTLSGMLMRKAKKVFENKT